MRCPAFSDSGRPRGSEIGAGYSGRAMWGVTMSIRNKRLLLSGSALMVLCLVAGAGLAQTPPQPEPTPPQQTPPTPEPAPTPAPQPPEPTPQPPAPTPGPAP